MDFVLVPLCSLCTFQAEILIDESKIIGNRTFPAGAAQIFRNTQHTFSRNTIEQLMIFQCAAVVRRTCRTDAHRPLFIGYLPAFFGIFFPGHVQPLFKCIHTDTSSSIPRDVIIDCRRILCTFFSVDQYFIDHFFQQSRIDRPYHFLNRLALTEKFEGGGAPHTITFGGPLVCHDVYPDKDHGILVFGSVILKIWFHLVAECTRGTIEHDRYGFCSFLYGFFPAEVIGFNQRFFCHQVPSQPDIRGCCSYSLSCVEHTGQCRPIIAGSRKVTRFPVFLYTSASMTGQIFNAVKPKDRSILLSGDQRSARRSCLFIV
jgi:hypothetical protein